MLQIDGLCCVDGARAGALDAMAAQVIESVKPGVYGIVLATNRKLPVVLALLNIRTNLQAGQPTPDELR